MHDKKRSQINDLLKKIVNLYFKIKFKKGKKNFPINFDFGQLISFIDNSVNFFLIQNSYNL
jgi:hypothetical protein